MTCGKCQGTTLFPDRDPMAPPYTFYCPYCSWRGRFAKPKEERMESVRKVVSEPPRVAAGSGKKKRVISEKQRAAVSAGVKRWHMKQGHKISTERINMQVVDGHATMEKEKAGDKIVVIVTQITPDQPSGSRTATVLLTVAQLEALVAPLGFHPVAA